MESLRLDDRFDLERQVGEGAMGVVYRGRDRLTGEPVAVKLMQQGLGTDERRFEREARILSQLGHPGVVRYIAHGKTQGRTYLAMEWLEGQTLAARLERGALSVGDCLALGIRVAEALAEAHRKGVVHRDLKPANLFLVGGRVADTKVLDFGVARWRWDARSLTHTGGTIGTPLYMSPEQARGRVDLDARSDIFSLGSVLHECLTHRPVFLGQDALAVLAKILREPAELVRARRPDTPVELEQLLEGMLAKDRGARPQTAEEVRDGLAGIRLGLTESDGAIALPHETTTAPPEAYRSVVLRAELRIVSVVLVKGSRPFAAASDPATTLSRTDVMPDAILSTVGETREVVPPPLALGELEAAVAPHQGRVDPLIDGSLIVSLAATPTPKEQAIHAARCALAMQRVLGDVPMAICTGQAVVQGRSAIGEVIERASIMLAESAGAGILIDGPTTTLLDGRFEIESGPQSRKLRGEREVRLARRVLLGKPTPYVGRERDLDVLRGYFHECADESVARVVLVTAPAGQGKTRLLEELLRRFRESATAPQVLVASADSLRSGSAFGTIAPALRAAAGVVQDAQPEAQRVQMRTFFGRHLAPEVADRVCPFLGELAGVPFDDSALPALAAARQQPRVMADQMLLAWLDWIDAVCAVGPLLVVLEDLHWADLPSVQFVEAALRTVRDKPLMVLGLARPEVHDRFPGLWNEHSLLTMRLAGLSRKASERLVQEALGDRVTAEKRAWLAERADGNPFFLEELIRAVDAGAEGAALPVTVLGMVHARLDALGDEAKHVVRAASVFGAQFPADGVRAVLGVGESDEDVARWLTILTEREIIYPGDREGARRVYGFRHALLRDAAYAMLTEGDRAMCHRLAGQWHEDSGETQAVVVAEHYERGSAPARAAIWFRKAADQAIEGNDLAGAIRCAERGIASGAAGELLGEFDWVIMEARQWGEQSAEAMGPGLEALRLLRPTSASWMRASGILVGVALSLGDTSRAEEIVRAMLGTNADYPCDAAGLLGLANGAYSMCSAQGAYQLDRDSTDELIDAFEQAYRRLTPHALALAWLDAVRGFRKLIDQEWVEALHFTEASADGFRRLGDMRGLTTALTQAGWIRLELGSLPRAEAALREAAELGERLGLLGGFEAKFNRSVVHFFQDKLADAEHICRTCLDEAKARQDPRIGILFYQLGRILLRQRKYEEAEREGRAAAAAMPEHSPYHPCAIAVIASALLGLLRPEEAIAETAPAARALEVDRVSRDGEAFVRIVHAEALHANGRVDEARSVLRIARDKVMARAAAISDSELQETFLHQVPDNARTLSLSREWCD